MKNVNTKSKITNFAFFKTIHNAPNHKIVNARVKNPNKMGQPLYLNSINPLLMRFLSSVKIWEQSQTIQKVAQDKIKKYSLFYFRSSPNGALSKYATSIQ